MMLGTVRLVRKVAPELLIGATSLALTAHLTTIGDAGAALPVLALGAMACGAGLLARHRAGELRLALRCPRLDRLGVRVESLDAPWQVLLLAEAALRTLDQEARRFRGFFVEARGWLRDAARRALAAHALGLRCAAALASAPDGDGRRQLEAGAARAREELASLAFALAELRAKLVVSTAPLAEVADPMPALARLEHQTAALADAVAELDGRAQTPAPAFVRSGGLR